MERVKRSVQRPEEQAEAAVRAILAIEREARETLAQAREEARRIVTSASRRAAELQEAANQEAQARAQAIWERGQAEVEQEADLIRQRGAERVAAWHQRAEQNLPNAVHFLVDAVAPSGSEEE